MVLLIRTIAKLRSHLSLRRSSDHKIGLVPTMGALHRGHLSLIQRAIAENQLVVVSIFVNPLQFAPSEDLQTYPRQLEQDLELCQQQGVGIVFAPEPSEMSSGGDTQALTQTTQVLPPQGMTRVLCGRYRPGHFEGVATIVTKLLSIVQPDRAYFGQKDAQQLAIIHRLVADLKLPVSVVGCPIVRESSGLALSSRNQYLTSAEQSQAAVIYQSLTLAQEALAQGETRGGKLQQLVIKHLQATPAIKVQYVELVDPNSLELIAEIKQSGLLAIAAYLGTTRLIDNMVLQKRAPIIAIDGPAGAGKSTVTRRLAQQLGLLYLDTGAMYRAVTWLAMQQGIVPENEEQVASLLPNLELKLSSPESFELPTVVYVNNQEVTTAIRTPEVTAKVSVIAAQAAVREKLVALQQQWGEAGGLIAEGRDIGTNVFPDAELKIFLTATPAERARRRLKDLEAQGRAEIDLKQLEQDIIQRDRQDSNRAIAPLKQAADAQELVTDDLTLEEVIAQIAAWYEQLP